MPKELVLKGMSELERALPREARLFRKCLSDLAAERPEIEVTIL